MGNQWGLWCRKVCLAAGHFCGLVCKTSTSQERSVYTVEFATPAHNSSLARALSSVASSLSTQFCRERLTRRPSVACVHPQCGAWLLRTLLGTEHAAVVMMVNGISCINHRTIGVRTDTGMFTTFACSSEDGLVNRQAAQATREQQRLGVRSRVELTCSTPGDNGASNRFVAGHCRRSRSLRRRENSAEGLAQIWCVKPPYCQHVDETSLNYKANTRAMRTMGMSCS